MISDVGEDHQGFLQVSRCFVELFFEPPCITAVAKSDGHSAAITKLVEDRHALLEKRQRCIDVIIVPAQNRKMPESASLPTPVSVPPEDLKGLGDQSGRLLAQPLIAEYQGKPYLCTGFFKLVIETVVNVYLPP